MKPVIRLTFLMVTIVALASSCSKVTIDIEPPVNTLVGSWVLTEAAHRDSKGWYTVNAGVEGGVFYFYNNGRAKYVEGRTVLEGTWDVQYVTSGYYDEYGSYYTDRHQSMSIHVADYYGDDRVDMVFDNVRINANSFVATNYNNNYIGRYKFSRY
jgi:hypothetical protein